MVLHNNESAQIDRMLGSEIGDVLDWLKPREMREMLIYISGYCPKSFEAALKKHACGLQADDDNWCMLPAGHKGSHDAGEFTWDTQAELDELHTIAVT